MGDRQKGPKTGASVVAPLVRWYAEDAPPLLRRVAPAREECAMDLIQDYTPLHLSARMNASPDTLPGHSLPVGRQVFRGLPFQIGPPVTAAGPCFLRLAGGDEPVTLPVGGQTAYHVIFAHRLLESRLPDGGPLGEVVAHYVVTYDDGSQERLAVRDRFEIATAPTAWGQLPFLAVPDLPDALPPRYQGAWGDAGERLTEVEQAWPGAYYLWAWANPHPQRALRSIEVQPAGPAFLLAAVTLGRLDEEPFCRAAASTVKITLPDPEDAARPFALGVTVDRGTATYPYPLPTAPQGFLDRPMGGFGAQANPGSSPAYVEVAASPSATVTVTQGEHTLGAVRWGDLERTGRAEPTPRLRVEVVDPGRNWVRTTVVDDATGQPVPCRVHFRSPDGVPYAPHGHHAQLNGGMGTWHVDVGGDVRLDGATYAYTDGTCEGWLPRGDVLVEAVRGFEYEPLRQQVRIEPGQQELTLRLKRWCDMNAQRYFSGDTHVHFLSTQGSHLEAQGEDLNVVNLLLSQWGHLFTNTEEWTGKPSVSPDGRTIVYATQENRQHMLGHLTLLGLKKQVMPWCSDGPSEAEMGGTLETTLAHWADACRQQGGTVVIPHLPTPNGEPAALIATGRADAVEMIQFGAYQHNEYYRYLNCGYRLPLVGGTDKMSNEVPVGLYRTYVRIPADEEFSYESWCRNLRAGRTFHSGGPMLRFTVDGHEIGDTLSLPGNGGTVEVEAWAESVLPISALQIVQNGQVVASTEEERGARSLHLRTTLTLNGHAWLAARAGGKGYFDTVPHHDVWGRGVMAHTSPIYVAVGGEWTLFDPGVATYMLTLVEGSLAYLRTRSRQHRPGTVTHFHGEADHQAFLERPFQEALQALHTRMHRMGLPH